MSSVTVEAIRADYEDAERAFLSACGEDDRIKTYWAMVAFRMKAMLYVIARDQGLEAAMLWKLSQP